jgi:hypothetical protein
VACAFVDNNMEEGVLKWQQWESVQLEACTFENNTVLKHNLLQTKSCGDSIHFYSESSLDVWCDEGSTTSKTQPLAAIPASEVILTAEDPFLTGLQQVCAGKPMSRMQGATKSASLPCAHLASTAWQATLQLT